jgi:hypothetical protein
MDADADIGALAAQVARNGLGADAASTLLTHYRFAPWHKRRRTLDAPEKNDRL